MKTIFKKLGIPLFNIILIGFFLRGKITHEPFDSKEWINWQETEVTLSTRWDMMNSLRQQFDLKSMSKTEILALLGTPEYQNNSQFIYYLGYSKRGIDIGSLSITFDSYDRVISYSVWSG